MPTRENLGMNTKIIRNIVNVQEAADRVLKKTASPQYENASHIILISKQRHNEYSFGYLDIFGYSQDNFI